MGSSQSSPISPSVLGALQQASDPTGFLRFDRFMELALYHSEWGYYRREQQRIGRNAETDFFTATSLGPVFGELVIAACRHQLGGRNPADYRFVEIGAENGVSVLKGLDHPFADVISVAVGQEHRLTGANIVFSNELFDAQPCRRLVRRGDVWHEIGLIINGTSLCEEERGLDETLEILPPEAPDGYHLDLPCQAAELATKMARQPWHGLFLAFDYGKSWTELSEATPQGTVRAYHQHKQTNALFERIGEQDLTCHVCWDWLSVSLQNNGFSTAPVLSQEAFLVKNAASALAKIMQEEATRVSSRKSGLMQLLHPSALGQKFQVLSAWRDNS